MEIKSIVVPDGWECIVKNGVATFQEKKENTQNPPRSWEEFCEKYPKQLGEVKIDSACNMYEIEKNTMRHLHADRNVYTSKEEAEAFLALMQLRQLRKAWVGDWEPIKGETYWGIYNNIVAGICDKPFAMSNTAMSFPTPEMTEDFLNCFKNLCEKAKILL